MLEKLSTRLQTMLDNAVLVSQYDTAKNLLNTITTTLENEDMIHTLDLEKVDSSANITEAHFNSLFEQIESSLDDSADVLSDLTVIYNDQLVDMLTAAEAIAKLNEVTNTKFNEVVQQIMMKNKNISINDEQFINIDFSKEPTSVDYDVVNNVLFLKRATTTRISNTDFIKININNNTFDYNKMTGAVNGNVIDNYMVQDVGYNDPMVLTDNLLNTKYIIQSLDEKPRIGLKIDTSQTQMFNFVSVFTNDTSKATVNQKLVTGLNNVYVTAPTSEMTMTVDSTTRYRDVYVPVMNILDKVSGVHLYDLSYFQTMNILDAESFSKIIESDDILEDQFNYEDIQAKTTQQLSQKHYKVNELAIADITIENNTYKTTGVWESGIIETGRNIISVEAQSDYITTDDTSVKFYVQIGNLDTWYEIEPAPINIMRPDDLFIPNRLVLDTDAVAEDDGDMVLNNVEDPTHVRLRINMETTNTAITPLIYAVYLRIKVAKA